MRLLAAAPVALLAAATLWAQASPEADRQATMRTLGITALIPGANADPAGARPANTDEARANPHPLPDPLLVAGRPVRTPAAWWTRGRPFVAETYAREVYGRVPDGIPPVRWQVEATDREVIGFGRRVVARQVVGTVADPRPGQPPVRIRMVVVLPADAPARVPVLIMFGPARFPAPSQPTADEYDRINAGLKALLIQRDPALAGVFDRHQALGFVAPPSFRLPDRQPKGDPPPAEQLIAAGWGYALLDPISAQADTGGEALRQGIIGLANRGQPRRPDQWGALRAWAWAASRALDWLSAEPGVDPARIGIEGVSRYGKAALVAMAFDRRFGIALIGSSGKGGVTPLRRRFGEEVGNLATGSYYWMAGNFLKYDTRGVSAPDLDAGDLPVDANGLLALCAPRPVFVSYGVPEAGDATWLDQRGSWMATVDASRVYRLLGQQGVATGPYATEPMPRVLEGRTGGALAWRQHDGGHTDAPNMASFLAWAAAHAKR